MTDRTHWSQIQEVGATSGMRFLFLIYKIFGRLPFNFFLFPVILYFFLFKKEARHASLDYLRHIKYNDKKNDFGPIYWQSFKQFFNFGSSLLDKLAVWTGEISLNDIDFEHRELLKNINNENKGGIIIGSHLGNLDVCRALSLQRPDLVINVFMHTEHASKFNALLKKSGIKNQLNVFSVTSISPATAILLKEKVDRGEFIVITADRTPPSGDTHTISTNFLGGKADFPTGPFVLACLLKCPVFTIFCLKNPRASTKRYSIHLELFSECIVAKRAQREKIIAQHVERYASVLERYCTTAPLQWYNFYAFWQQERNGDYSAQKTTSSS